MTILAGTAASAEHSGREPCNPRLTLYMESAVKQFDQIPAERRTALERIAKYVQDQVRGGREARLTFICTHNSRRSHLGQAWARAAACYYGVPSVKTFSGGTEATACNPRTVAALERAGFDVKRTSEAKNPVYEIVFSQSHEPVKAFSKRYSDPPNPTSDFCAVMTCDQADQACPWIDGCSLRVAIPYEDPKKHDGTPAEASSYDARCRQICREMLYVFSKVNVEPTEK